MADMMETIEHLATEIGPRPVATEEEQQAALYIADEFEAAGLPAEIEEFQGAISNKKTRLVCSAVAVVMALVSLFVSALALPAVIVAILCAALFAAEELGKPVLSKVLDKGISQNVVARYVPEAAQKGSPRRRKVILVARTDSGSVQPELSGALLSAMPILAKASRIGMVALPVLLLIKALFFLHSTGVAFVIMTILMVLACICAILPAVSFIVSKTSGLTDGANSSASGVAVMLEVARRVNGGNVEAQPVIRGAEAAYAADVVPEGAELVYEDVAPVSPAIVVEESVLQTPVEQPAPVDYDAVDGSDADRLLAAKAAIAAMTGKPVSDTVSIDLAQPAAEEAPAAQAPVAAAVAVPAAIAAGAAAGFAVDAAAGEIVNTAAGLENLVESGVEQESAEAFEPVAEAPAFVAVKNDVPSWFTAGRAAARRDESGEAGVVIRRNSHAAALEAAEQRLNAVAYEESIVAPNMEERLLQLQEAAQNVQAPQYDRELVAAPVIEEQPEVVAEAVEAVEPRIAMADFAASPLVQPQVDAAPAAVEPLPEIQPEPEPEPELASEPRFMEPLVVTTSIAAELDQPVVEVATDENAEPLVEFVPAEEPAPAVAEPAPIPMDYFMAAAGVANVGDTVVAQPVSAEARQPLTLPDLSATGSIPVVDIQKQRAPLAEAEESGQNVAKGLLNMLPAIDPIASEQPDLRSTLPSLSGAFVRVPSPNSPSLSQQFEPVAGATGSFAPVTEALVMEAESEEDLFVDDADDSVFEENYTETGAFAGPEYVDMPKKRGLGIFDKIFGRDKKEDQLISSGWSDEDDFASPSSNDAWDDLADDEGYDGIDDDYDDYEDDYEYEYDEDDDDWKGGAFSGKLSGLAEGASGIASGIKGGAAGVASRVRGAIPAGKGGAEAAEGRGRRRGAADEAAEEARAARTEERESRRAARRSENDEYARVYQMIASRAEASAEGAAEALAPEVDPLGAWAADDAQQQISSFRASGINTEVWFVALGAETDSHAGMSAFIEEHKPELRGAIVIELDSLGAGVLSTVTKEGVLQPVSASSRMRRYANRASQSSGVPVETTSILWGESAASTAIRKGLQAMHLVGMDGAKPAYYAEADDIAENIEPEILAENANFVVEVLKNI